jgi:hypothetical protein
MKRTNTELRSKGPWKGLRPTGACVDWITLTATPEGSGGQLWAIGERLLRQDDSVGDCALPWQMKGYRGWHTPHVRMGSRPSGVLLSLSSQKSSDNWRDALAAAENCSRLDCAVDVRCDPPKPTVALDIYRNMGHKPSRSGRPSSSRLIMGSDGGSTVYIGSRQSEFFGRVYDKGIEQQTHRRGEWWRWELEVKGSSAKVLSHQLSSVDVESVAIGCIVARWFRERCGVSFTFSDAIALCKWEPEPTTVDQKLLWLSRQVRPTVIELLRRGERERIWAALDLPMQSAVKDVSTC